MDKRRNLHKVGRGTSKTEPFYKDWKVSNLANEIRQEYGRRVLPEYEQEKGHAYFPNGGARDFEEWARKRPDYDEMQQRMNTQIAKDNGVYQESLDNIRKDTDNAHEAEMRKRFPEWDRYNDDTKRALAIAPLLNKMDDGFLKTISQGANDPIIRDGLQTTTNFLIDGVKSIAKSLITGDREGAIKDIGKNFLDGMNQAVHATRYKDVSGSGLRYTHKKDHSRYSKHKHLKY